MRVVAAQKTAAPATIPDHLADDDLVIDLRDHVLDDAGPVVSFRPPAPPAPATPGRTLHAVLVVVAVVIAAAALLVTWPDDGSRERVITPDATTTAPAPAAVETTVPAPDPVAEQPAPVEEAPATPATTVAPRPVPARAAPATTVVPVPAPAPAPVIVVERSTTSIELFLAEDPAESSATMAVGPSPGVDRIRVELLADLPTEGTRVPVQVEIVNDDDVAIDFPGPITVTVIGERDGQRVAEAVLQVPGVTRLAARSTQRLTGEIELTLGTTTLRAELPMQEPAR